MSDQKRQGRPPYPAEFRERAVRMVFEHQDEYPSQWKAIESIAEEAAGQPRDVAPVGSQSGDRRRPAAGFDDRRAGSDEGARAGGNGSCAGRMRS